MKSKKQIQKDSDEFKQQYESYKDRFDDYDPNDDLTLDELFDYMNTYKSLYDYTKEVLN